MDVQMTLIVAAGHKARLIDVLLAQGYSAFYSQNIAEHGGPVGELSVTEQVLGHQRKTMMTLMGDQARIDALLSVLRDEFKGSGLRYSISPVVAAGVI